MGLSKGEMDTYTGKKNKNLASEKNKEFNI